MTPDQAQPANPDALGDVGAWAVALLFRRFGPYHHARARAAGAVLPLAGLEFVRVDKTYAWDVVATGQDFKLITLFSNEHADSRLGPEVAERLGQTLASLAPRVVVIPGWSDRFALLALAWALDSHVPVVVMSESTAWDERRVWWREAAKHQIVRLCSAGLVGGTPHHRYLASLGLPRDRVFLGYDAVDNEYFARRAEDARGRAVELRKKHGLPDRYFLASARFIGKKNLPRLLRAYARYRELADGAEVRGRRSEVSKPWQLVLLGDGLLKAELCRLISDLSLEECVHLPGFKQYDELPVYYGLASAFIHASTTEPWGLVVNEAMASGLPVLVSNRCGCASDLVQEGGNGFTFDPYDTEQLARLMLKLSAFDFPLAAFASASSRGIAAWGPERFAQGLKAAAKKALEVGPIKASLLQRLVLKALLWR